jgi:uncharacterized protein YjbI with pentapeptide repeats
MPLFPPPAANFVDPNDAQYKKYVMQDKQMLQRRWAEPEGLNLLHTLLGNGLDRTVLHKHVGKIYDKYDLRGAPLSGRRLANVDLSDCDLFAADLSEADLSRSNLQNCLLSEADIRGTRFDWCQMSGAYVDKVKFDLHTSFMGVNLESINFNLAALLREAAISQQVVLDLEERHPRLAWLLRATSDYGRSFTRFALWCAGIMLAFAMFYQLLPDSTNAAAFGERLYFSVLTFTTLGFGTVTAISLAGKLLVVLEVLAGYFMMGLLIAILSKKVLR